MDNYDYVDRHAKEIEARQRAKNKEPPHCPTCSCGMPPDDVSRYRKALEQICERGRNPIAEKALGLSDSASDKP